MFKPKSTNNTTSSNKQRNPELTMEGYVTAKSLVLQGCRLAKGLESNIDDALCKAEESATLCDQIANIFGSAGERLRSGLQGHQAIQASGTIDQPSLHEWIAKSNGFDAIQPVSSQGTSTGQLAMDWLFSPARDPNPCSSSSSQRSRRRRDDAEVRITKMAAPQIGNTEIPPEDGYTWRKYGQKEIMGKKYPRSYYRCTHQRQFNCPAKKQVQRDDGDPSTFEVMYRGRHTCHLSATAPSMLPPPPPPHDNAMSSHQLLSSSTAAAIGSWLSMHAGAGAAAAPDFPVVDMADAMFNSGSSSTSNSMEFLFPNSVEDHKRSDHVGTKKMAG